MGINFYFLKFLFWYFEDNCFLFLMNRCIYYLFILRKEKNDWKWLLIGFVILNLVLKSVMVKNLIILEILNCVVWLFVVIINGKVWM